MYLADPFLSGVIILSYQAVTVSFMSFLSPFTTLVVYNNMSLVSAQLGNIVLRFVRKFMSVVKCDSRYVSVRSDFFIIVIGLYFS